MVLHIWDHIFVGWPIPMWLLAAFMWTTECKKYLVLTFRPHSPSQTTTYEDGDEQSRNGSYHTSNDNPWITNWKWIKIIDVKRKEYQERRRTERGRHYTKRGEGMTAHYLKVNTTTRKTKKGGGGDKGEIPWGGTGIRRLKMYKRVCKEVGRRKLRIEDMKCKTEKKKKGRNGWSIRRNQSTEGKRKRGWRRHLVFLTQFFKV